MVRYDWVSYYIYHDIQELQDKTINWLWIYNYEGL